MNNIIHLSKKPKPGAEGSVNQDKIPNVAE